MLRNHLKLAFRNITRHQGFSLINIAGLTLGLTVFILIGLFVWDENQYDKFVPGAGQIFRIADQYSNNEGTVVMAVSPPMLATTLQSDFPEVEKTTRVLMTAPTKTLFEAGGKQLYEENGFFVDSTFFDVFALSFSYGSLQHALADPSSIVISDEMAKRYFDNQDPLGQKILMDKTPYQIKGVFRKNPKFHLQFDYLVPIAAVHLPPDRMQSWSWHQFFTYVKLKPKANIEAMTLRLQQDVAQKIKLSQHDAGTSDKPFFQALGDIHLKSSNFKFDMARRGNITYVRALSIIAVFILLIACFNFVNLATAKSLQRAKEVGVRKSVGAGRNQLLGQFLGETVLLSAISLVIAMLLSILLLPWFNQVTNKEINTSVFASPVFLSLAILLSFGVGVVAGFYPALVLSGYNPVDVLKGTPITTGDSWRISWLRKGLVITQFSLSVLLIVSAVVVFNQVNYLHHKDLGFNKDQIMFFPMRGDNMSKNVDAFKNELLQAPGVSSVSIGYGFPGDAVAGDEILVEKQGQKLSQPATQLTVDYDYIKTLGLHIIAGRDFSAAMKSDKDHAWIINETAVAQLGFKTPQLALGKDLYWHPWGANNPDSLKEGKVIGVVKDFNYSSLFDKVGTTVIQIFPDAAWKVAVKMKTAGVENTITAVKNTWTKFSPEYPIEYKFLDDNFEAMYSAEDKLRSLLLVFTSLAIFVACLGLFGLAAYTAERRKKEVGIRKVLGATTQGLVVLLSKDFMKLVLISLVAAFPIGWLLMNKWLEDFAYRVNIGLWVFIAAGIVALSIAFVTVCFQAIKAATANPVKSLRAE
jgi:putative ABC transport system permease protein